MSSAGGESIGIELKMAASIIAGSEIMASVAGS